MSLGRPNFSSMDRSSFWVGLITLLRILGEIAKGFVTVGKIKWSTSHGNVIDIVQNLGFVVARLRVSDWFFVRAEKL
jgi:hypothetical protein